MKGGKNATICYIALGFLQMVPSVAQLKKKEKGFYSIFTQVLQNLHTSLLCQIGVGMFTSLFNLPHLPSIPTAAHCILFPVMVRQHNALGLPLDLYPALFMQAASNDSCSGRVFCAGWKSLLPFILQMALSLLTITF